MQCFYGFVTFCVVLLAGILGAFTANDLYKVTGEANSELLQDLRNAITGLAVRCL